jgi:hypothetical protein
VSFDTPLPLNDYLVGRGQTNRKDSVDALQRRRQGESQQTLADVLSVFIFEQTEYVYSFLSLANGRGDGRAFAQLPIVYQRCLESYETVTNYLQQQGDSTPSTLFVQ